MRYLILLSFLAYSGPIGVADESIDDLARAVEANEKLYESLEITLAESYELHRRLVPAAGGQIRLYQDSETRLSLVLQGSSFRLHSTKIAHMPPEHVTLDSTRIFDGTTYQSYHQKATKDSLTGQMTLGKSHGHISDQSPKLTNLARPHMFLLNGCPQVPLSTYLRGHDAVRKHPNPGYFPAKNIVEVHDLGREEFEELQCRVVLINTLKAQGKRHHAWKLWLAEKRNLIPVRKLSYTDRWSTEIPVAEGIVDEWQELRPGVWFPAKAHVQRYDSFVIHREGKQQPRFRRTYEVTAVSLEPQTTPETFTKLDFPPGTEVRIEKEGGDDR